VIYYELLVPSETVTVNLDQRQLIRLNQELERKRPYGERERPVKLVHDNVKSHIASKIKNIIMNVL